MFLKRQCKGTAYPHILFSKDKKIKIRKSQIPISADLRIFHKRYYLIYLFFFHSLLISSNVLPFVSGTQRQTKIAAATQIIP